MPSLGHFDKLHAAAEGYGATACKDAQKNKVKSWYRPDIDGLRAIAVIVVIIYHMQKSWLPGGFLGVDMFFVISGYVVTGSVLRHPSSGICECFTSFYVRRIKRIAPNLICVTVFAATLMAVVTPPYLEKLKDNLICGVYGIFGLSNNYLAVEGLDYFHDDANDMQNPFLHTWSLGVEEQFYLLYPLFFLAAYGSNHEHFDQRTEQTSPRLRSAATWSVAILLSMLTFIVLMSGKRTIAFYTIPSRFWQLASGALVLDTQAVWSIWMQRWKVTIVLQMIAVASMGVAFTGLATRAGHVCILGPGVTVLGTVCYIMVGVTPGSHLNKCLSHGLPVYIGKLSYSLYLWHWPILTLLIWISPRGSLAYFVQALVMIMAASIAAYHSVEHVCRTARNSRPVIVFAATFMAMCGATAWLMALRGPLHGKFFVTVHSSAASIPNDIQSHKDSHPQCSCQGIETGSASRQGALPFCFKYTDLHEEGHISPWTLPMVKDCDYRDVGDEAAKACMSMKHEHATSSIYLFGDSHAGHLVPGLQQAAASANLSIRPMFRSGGGLKDAKYKKLVFSHLEKHLRVGDIVVVAHASWKTEELAKLNENPILSLHNITSTRNAQMLLVGDTTCPENAKFNRGLECTLVGETPISDQPCTVPRSDVESYIYEEGQRLKHLSQMYDDIHLLDLGDAFCTDALCSPLIPKTNVLGVFADCHLTLSSSYYLWPRFCSIFMDLSQ